MTGDSAEDPRVERLPLSVPSAALRLALVALLVPVLWLPFGALAGGITAAGLALLAVVFVPRALVLDEEGFRVVSLLPRKKVLWSAVDSFDVGYALRAGEFVLYTKAGRRPRSWFPAGWPAQGSVPAVFASRPGERALRATELCRLLNERLAREAARFSRS